MGVLKRDLRSPLPCLPRQGEGLRAHCRSALHLGLTIFERVHEEHEVTKFENINFRILRVSRRLIRPSADPCLVRFVVKRYFVIDLSA